MWIVTMIEHAAELNQLLVWAILGILGIVGAIGGALIALLVWIANRWVSDMDGVKESLSGIKDSVASIERSWTDKLHGVVGQLHDIRERVSKLEMFHRGEHIQD